MPVSKMSSTMSRSPGAHLRRDFHQHVPGMRRIERIARAGDMLQHAFQAEAGEQFEARDVAAGARLRDAEQIDRGLRRGQAEKRDLDRARPRHQPQHRRGDDAERAFGADEQILQVVAGIVLLQLVEIVQHAAVGQHHFEAERMRARDAMRERRGAAGIGGEIAADGAGAFARQTVADRAGRLAPPPRARAASVAPASTVMVLVTGSISRILVMRLSESTISLLNGICPPTSPVLPPCGTIAVRVSFASLRISRNLRGGFGPQHQRRRADPAVAHLVQIGCLQVRIGEGVFFADDRRQPGDQVLVGLEHALILRVRTRGGGAAQPVVDRFAEAVRRYAQTAMLAGQRPSSRRNDAEQIRGRLDDVAGRRQIHDSAGAAAVEIGVAEGQQSFAVFYVHGIEPKPRARRIMRLQHARRERGFIRGFRGLGKGHGRARARSRDAKRRRAAAAPVHRDSRRWWIRRRLTQGPPSTIRSMRPFRSAATWAAEVGDT